MKILKIIFIVLLLILIGGFAYFAFTDVPVEQENVSKEIPNSRFFEE